ncbi:hypothetical protein [Bradyrhizobium sp. BR13661]|jgi:hypothetical protein|uniref:hypothetical protein n=1 Tax=Bradyrhizobium sp. BR13661 TaxID=2940622 RepID=UPI0024741343|nr:hypothetical protein [Bradyrhizobium sp. BR13661]MDH6259035.1 septation ring formation regulator EzrA [Bradyrhizobium sp. BR13661]
MPDIQDHVAAAIARCESKPLPFVELDPDNRDIPRSAWSVTETGDYEADVTRGLVYAEALIQHSKRFGSFLGRGALEAVLQEVVLRGKVGPIEQGFLGRIAMAAIVASQN